MDRVHVDLAVESGKSFFMIQILIVDDEADTHLLYKLKLKKIFAPVGSLEIMSFLSGKECLEYLKSHKGAPIDLILTDINMPEMDGFELLKEIRKFDSVTPIYVVSAYESAEYKRRASQLGSNRYLSKPVDFNLLGEAFKADLNISF